VQGESDRVWYVARGMDTYGPFSDDGFAQLASSGQLGLTDYVWYSGLSNWVLCEQLCPQNAYSNVPGRGAAVPTGPEIVLERRALHKLPLVHQEARFLGAVGPAALAPEQQPGLAELHAAVCDLQAITADAGAARRTAADVAGGAFPVAAAIGTRSVHAPTAIIPTVLSGLSDLLTRCAAFVRGRVDQRLLRRTPSFYFRAFVLLPLIFTALWWLTFYGRAFWSENIEARISGALGKEIRDAVADTKKATGLAAAARAGAVTPKKGASKEANKSPAPKEAKAVAKTNPVPKQPVAKDVTQDTTPDWIRQLFGN